MPVMYNGIDGRIKKIWDGFIGNTGEFSMENRAFNYVCLISFPLLVFAGIFDYCISEEPITAVIVTLLLILVVLFYLSRYKKIYNPGIFIYAIASYVTLIYNYFVNAGVFGPTVILFILTFQLLMSVGKRKLFPLWICLHVIITLYLLYAEYTDAGCIHDGYFTRKERFLDIASNFVIAIAFIYGTTNYLRRSFNNERLLAEQRALAIQEQNNHIIAQNQTLERVNEEKNKLFSIVSHDLKSPLDSIRGYLELISEDLLQGDEKAKMEAELLDRTKYTSDLLVSLLTWAKTQMEGMNAHLVPVDIEETIMSIAKDKMLLAAKKGIEITYDIAHGAGAMCDKDMLLIVLRNLVNNAIKFSEPRAHISVTAVRKGDMVEISVKDTGVGIPPDRQADIFSHRTKSSYGTNKEKGTGLGLVMCKSFMDHQHGEIWFESRAGAGSVFYISLPFAAIK